VVGLQDDETEASASIYARLSWAEGAAQTTMLWRVLDVAA
jgi:hypothetical protein